MIPQSRLLRAIATTVALATFSTVASAQQWYANLSGAQENPPVASAGVGYGFFSLAGDMLTINITFSGLTGTTTASHVHCCAAPPTNAGVATQTPTFSGFPLGVTSGTYSNTFDLTLSTSWNPAFITAQGGSIANARAALIGGMNSGNAYLNIHTSVAGGGEIRGAITTVPEPGTVALTAAGMLALAGFARRRRRVA